MVNFLKNVNHSAWYKWIELSILYIISPLLIALNLIDLKYRWLLFAITFLYIASLIKSFKPTLKDFKIIGFEISKLLKWLLLYALGVIIIVLLLYFEGIITSKLSIIYLVVFIAYPLISAPIQELFFRSFYFYRYSNLINQSIIIFLNILLFAFYHKIYGGWISVVLSFIGGIIITFIYLKNNSFWWACFCHGIFGVMVFFLGLGKYFTDLIN